MKKIVLYFVTFLPALSLYAQLPAIDWQRTLGGTGFEQAVDVSQLQDNNFIAVGITKSTNGDVTAFYGGYDIWMVKLDNTGNILWQKTFGGSADDTVENVSRTSDGGFLVIGNTKSTNGSFSDNDSTNPPHVRIFCAKFDTDGTLIWKKFVGPLDGGFGEGISETSDGGYICVSYVYNAPPGNPSAGSYDVMVTKLTAGLGTSWEQTFGGSGGDSAWRVIENTAGEYLFTGTTMSGHNNLLQNNGNSDIWFVKLDASGRLVWQRNYGGPGFDTPKNLIQTVDGGYLLINTGQGAGGDITESFGGDDAWAIKTDSEGVMEWQHSYGGLGMEDVRVIYPWQGGYVIGGSTTSAAINNITVAGYGNRDFWVFKIDQYGALDWNIKYGGSGDDYLFGFSGALDGGFIMGGWTYSNDGQVSGNHSTNQADYWVVKLNDGNLNVQPAKVEGIGAYPNPAYEQLNFTGIKGDTSIEVFDVTGRYVQQLKCNNGIANVSTLTKGVYILKLYTGTQTAVIKFIKK